MSNMIMKTKLGITVLLAGCVTTGANGTSSPPEQTEAAAITAPADHSAEAGTLVISGRNFLMGGKFTEAVALLEKAHSLQPANIEACFFLSSAYVELKRYGEALPMLEDLLLKLPDNPMVKNNLAWSLLHTKEKSGQNPARAIKLARTALLAVPSDSDYAASIWNTLGEAYYAAGRFDKALQAAQSGLSLNLLAGVTNSPCRELVSRSRKAASAASLDDGDSKRP